MKRLVLLLSFAVAISLPAFGQSSMVFDAGTTVELTAGADISADVVTINGTFSGDGTVNGSPLPVTLAWFTVQANPHGPGVLLEWMTASEINNYGFYVQCRVASEQSFQEVLNSFVPGHGTTLEPQHYSYTHSPGVAGEYEYRLKQVDLDGTVHFPQPIKVQLSRSVLTEEIPTEFCLNQNYPNPFNPRTTIRYGLPVKAHVSLAVYNALGQLVSKLADEEQEAGYHNVKFDGSSLSSGVYFYRLRAGDFVQTRKLLLVR